jgi:hypothetical protein
VPKETRQATRSVTREYKRQRAEKETGLELYFAREPLPEDEPVRVFQHTMKTGGTSLRALIYYNVSKTAVTRADHEAIESVA